jgi:hypothetical protein
MTDLTAVEVLPSGGAVASYTSFPWKMGRGLFTRSRPALYVG